MNDPRLLALLDQLEMTQLMLERPAVQNQLLAFVAIFLLAWLLPEPLGILLKRLIAQQEKSSKRQQKLGLPVNQWRTRLLRWLRGAQLLLFPIVGWVLIQVTMRYFASRDWPLGLLDRLATIFWLLLAYQVVGTFFVGTMPAEKARQYLRRLVLPAFIILVIVSLSSGLYGAFPIARIVLFSIGNAQLTVATIGTAAIALYATFALGWLTTELLSNVVLPRAHLDSSVTSIVTIISRYTVLAIGILTAVSILGVDLSTFAIIGGGLSVGIGFGLQDLIANFISGILLLFERTLRPGDVIEVAGQRGRVAEMRMRSAVLRTSENVDVYVPNKTLLTSVVADYTRLKLATRKTLNIGVSYDSDPIKVRDTLQEVVESHGLVLKDPPPEVFFIGFGSFTLDFEVAVSIREPGRASQILSDLHFMIFREFGKRGIEIPIPQQDFNLRTTSISPVEQLLAPMMEGNGGSAGSRPSGMEGGKTTSTMGKRTVEESTAQKSSSEQVRAPSEKPKLPG